MHRRLPLLLALLALVLPLSLLTEAGSGGPYQPSAHHASIARLR